VAEVAEVAAAEPELGQAEPQQARPGVLPAVEVWREEESPAAASPAREEESPAAREEQVRAAARAQPVRVQAEQVQAEQV
jgi:hypothetical protein